MSLHRLHSYFKCRANPCASAACQCGSIVVAIIDSEFTVKALYNARGYLKLKSESLTYPGIALKENQKLEISDMVESCTKKRPASAASSDYKAERRCSQAKARGQTTGRTGQRSAGKNEEPLHGCGGVTRQTHSLQPVTGDPSWRQSTPLRENCPAPATGLDPYQ